MSNNQNLRKINLNHLPVFIAIAETKSLTAAARSLGYEKTRVSRILAEFESDLNAELVYRTTRDLHLTEAGQLFYERCKKILSELEEATNQLSHTDGEISGHICMTAAHGITSALLPPILKEFNKLHPRITFEIILTQHALNLVKEGVDVALRVGSLQDSSYKAKKIGEVHYAFAATPQFLSTHPHPRKIEDLSTMRTLALPNFNNKPITLKNTKEHKETELKLSSPLICNSPDFLLDLTLQDMGIGLLPEFICRDHFKTGQLIQLFENWEANTLPISLLFHASNRKGTPVSLFIAFLSFHFANLLN